MVLDMEFAFILCLILGYMSHTTGQGDLGGEDGSFCCPLISVDAQTEAGLEHMSGEYSLKEDKVEKPEDVCVNGCIYTKDGSPATEHYCFRQQDIPGVNLECRVGITY